jgi:hypothetical protein
MCSSSGSGPVQALAAVRSTLSDAVRDGVEDLSHDQCAELMAQLRATAAQVDALTLDVLGKVEADGTFALDGAVTAGSWMRAVSHATPGEAARAVRTARVLRSGLLPNTAAALAAGAISARHAAVIADGVTGAPAGAVELIEPEVVATAVEGDVRATAAVMRAFQHALDPERADEAALRRYERHLRDPRHRRRGHRRPRPSSHRQRLAAAARRDPDRCPSPPRRSGPDLPALARHRGHRRSRRAGRADRAGRAGQAHRAVAQPAGRHPGFCRPARRDLSRRHPVMGRPDHRQHRGPARLRRPSHLRHPRLRRAGRGSRHEPALLHGRATSRHHRP